MKKHSVIFLSLCAIALGASQPLPSFDGKIQLPPLSLSKALKISPLGIMGDAQAWFRYMSPSTATEPGPIWGRSIARATVSPQKLVSHMPIIAPKVHADQKILHAPKTTVDYKLEVRTPTVESASK